MNQKEQTSAVNTYKASIALDGIVFHIRSYHSNVVAENEIHPITHCHFSTEIQYIYSGSIEVFSEETGKTHRLHAKDCCIIPGGHYHKAVASAKFERLPFNYHIERNLLFEQEPSKEYEALEQIYKGSSDIQVLRDPMLSQLFEQYRQIAGDVQRIRSVERRTAFLSIIMRVLNLMSKELSESTTGAEKERESTESANRKWIIEEHIADRYMYADGLAELAKKLYLSERQTRTLILRTFGKNYKDMVIEQRMEIADMLMRDPSLSLEAVAEKVGYTSYSGFYVAYRKYYGVSPEEKRQR